MSKMVDIMYEAYEKRREEEIERSESDASSTSSGAYVYYSSPSLNGEINQRLQEGNVELRRLLREEKEEKLTFLRQLQAKDETLEKL